MVCRQPVEAGTRGMNVVFPVERWHVVTEEVITLPVAELAGPVLKSPGFPALGPRMAGPWARVTRKSSCREAAPR